MEQKELKTRQIVDRGFVKYIDDEGWEDECPIEISRPPLPSKRHKQIVEKKFVVLFPNNHWKNILINKFIGVEQYKKANNKTRYILLKDATKEFKRFLISIYGSQGNYLRKWVKQRLGISWSEYQGYLAKNRGFKDSYDYKKFLAKRLGFKSYSDYQQSLVQKKGFKNRTEYSKFLWKNQGFKSQYEYELFNCKRAGFKLINERRKYREKKKNENKK